MSGVWTTADMPELTGRTAVVTGPTLGGLGHHTALELARRGARVVLAGRTPAKLETAAEAVTSEVPEAALETLVVDLSDLGSVRTAAEQARGLGPLHLLVNNAGIMASPFRRTADGLESQMATNHFGGCGAPASRSPRSPRTPASPAPTSSSTASSAPPKGGARRSWTRR